MFGYVSVNRSALSDDEYMRFRTAYCGLCKTLRQNYGSIGRMSLSYDMTFLALLLNALYEPEEITGNERCALHPLKPHAYVTNRYFEYAADLNVALTYHKCMDNWTDDKSAAGLAAAQLLKAKYRLAESRIPNKCAAIRRWLEKQAQLEKDNCTNADLCANLSGEALGELYVYQNDTWADTLRRMGQAMGRFIYFMDAYEDLPQDIRRNRFNPLRSMAQRPDYEDICRDILTLLIAECAEQFELLPIVKDASVLRNVLYSGVWGRYTMLQAKKEKQTKKGTV